MNETPNILSIGGSDPSSGAGIQGDIISAGALGCNCFTAVTATTVQNTSQYISSNPVRPSVVSNQIRAVLDDIRIDAAKVGMTYNTGIAKAILGSMDTGVPMIVDPVMRSTTGGRLLGSSSLDGLLEIISAARIVTPNVQEALAISAYAKSGRAQGDTRMVPPRDEILEEAMDAILGAGAGAVLVTGVQCGRHVCDILKASGYTTRIRNERIRAENHGGGCAHAMAVAHYLAQRGDVARAARQAAEFSQKVMQNLQGVGRGVPVPSGDPVINTLQKAVTKFTQMKNASRLIPECQTNFVFSAKGPKTADHVAGLSGRLVRAGGGVVAVGRVEYGGSKHVATAVAEISKKFPQIRSAANIRFDKKTLSAFKGAGLDIREYDRAEEPPRNKRAGSSIAWGVKKAIKNTKRPPDAIFHRGDVGKEAMVLVFGSTPQEVLSKIGKLP